MGIQHTALSAVPPSGRPVCTKPPKLTLDQHIQALSNMFDDELNRPNSNIDWAHAIVNEVITLALTLSTTLTNKEMETSNG